MIFIVGAGAMGSLFGALLARRNIDVILIEKKEEIVESINRKGISVGGIEEFKAYPKAVQQPPSTFRPDIVMLFTKSYSTRDALEQLAPLIDRNTVIVTLQNGLGNEEVAMNFSQKVVGGITTNSAILKAPGKVEWTGKGITVIGKYPSGWDSYVESIRHLLMEADLSPIVSNNIISWKWTKTIVNAAINPIGAILKVNNGTILENKTLLELAQKIVKEGKRVASKLGVQLEQDPEILLLETLKMTRENLNSMLQDLMFCRRTEIDYINGKIVEFGEKIRVNVGMNYVLWALIKFLEDKCSRNS